MEACATSRHWGRVARSYGHVARLIPANYVKPFVKRQKNDRADAQAIAEAAVRPSMRFVAVKSAEKQGRAVAFRTHQCFVRQRTQLINSLRGHLAEFGIVAAKGPASLALLEKVLVDPAADLPDRVREIGAFYLQQIDRLTAVIEQLAKDLESATKTDEELRRLCTVPGIGPVTAGAIAAFAPDLQTFDSGRNFAAWLGLVPRQRSTGGKTRLFRQQNRTMRHTQIADHRGDERDPMGRSQRQQLEPVVGKSGCAQAAHGCCCGAGQQDGADDL